MLEWLILMCLNMIIGFYVINVVCGCEIFDCGMNNFLIFIYKI